MEQQLDNLAKNKDRDDYEKYIVKYDKFSFFRKHLNPYVPASFALKYAVIAYSFKV